MRRALAITLLIALFAPGLASSISALTNDPEANLPACCRSHGAHHCAMRHWMLQALDSGTAKFTAAPCPLYPNGAVVPQAATFALASSSGLAVEAMHTSASPAETERRVQLLLVCTRRDRGPPADLV